MGLGQAQANLVTHAKLQVVPFFEIFFNLTATLHMFIFQIK